MSGTVFAPGDALLVVDVFNDFDHDDGDKLLGSFRERTPHMAEALQAARRAKVPVVYVNEEGGRWRSDAARVVQSALQGKGGDLVEGLVPGESDAVILKHRYSAFDHTPLEILLELREVERIVLIGSATEGCVVQTAIDARELGLKVTILEDACATTGSELEEIALRYAARVGGVRVERISEP
jgi:nicotinamidase-related amidase